MSRHESPATTTYSRIGKRGTLVIPASLRRNLGLEEGTPVIAEERDGGLFIRSAVVDLLTERERKELIDDANAAYAALRADPVGWAAEQAERAAWQSIAGETLPEEPW